jgi:hypothetical protein
MRGDYRNEWRATPGPPASGEGKGFLATLFLTVAPAGKVTLPLLTGAIVRDCEPCPSSGSECVNVSYWPKADELGDAIGRQLSRVHRTCCQRSRKGSP